MSRQQRSSRRLLLPLLLGLGVVALVAAMLRREERTAWPLPDAASSVWPPATDQPPQRTSAPAAAGPPAAVAAPSPGPPAAGGAPAAGVEALMRLSRQELYRRAQALEIPGRSRMSKRQLAEALATTD